MYKTNCIQSIEKISTWEVFICICFKINIKPLIFWDILQAGQTMICNNTYLTDIQRVCEIKDLIWVIRFQSH